MTIFIATSLFFLIALFGSAGLLAAMTRQYWQRIGAMLRDGVTSGNRRSGSSGFTAIGTV